MINECNVLGVTPKTWERSYRLSVPLGWTFFYRNSYGMVGTDYGPSILQNVLFFDADLVSHDFLIIGDKSARNYLLIGAITARRSLTSLTLHVRQKRFMGITLKQEELAQDEAGEEIYSEHGRDWRELLSRYADKAARAVGVGPALPQGSKKAANVCGYCSWYYAYQSLSETDFLGNVASLQANLHQFPAVYAQIDDGYQTHHGDWLANNSQWPRPLSAVAEHITEAGLIPGIWTMPLLASTSSEIFQQHPEWFVTEPSGEPLLIHGWSPPPDELWACLDASREDVRDHLAAIYRRLYADGFRYFKLDGLGLSYPAGRRAAPGETGTSCLRRALQIIREAVKDSIVLNCGGPHLAALGWVDHSRVSTDTGIHWKSSGPPEPAPAEVPDDHLQDPTIPCLFNAIRQSLHAWWMADRWFRTDPDVVIVRDNKTCLSIGESRMSALVGILTGVVFTSDQLDCMSQDRMALLARAARFRLRTAKPLDFWQNGSPCAFRGQVDEMTAVAIFNFARQARSYSLAELGLNSVEELLHPLGPASQTIKVPPHDGVLLVEVSS